MTKKIEPQLIKGIVQVFGEPHTFVVSVSPDALLAWEETKANGIKAKASKGKFDEIPFTISARAADGQYVANFPPRACYSSALAEFVESHAADILGQQKSMLNKLGRNGGLPNGNHRSAVQNGRSGNGNGRQSGRY